MNDKPRLFLGVDIGIEGGLGFIWQGSMQGAAYTMPVIGEKGSGPRSFDLPGIVDLISMYEKNHLITAVIEDVSYSPTWEKYTLTLQYSCLGMFMGIFAAYKIPYMVVTAKRWQKVIFEGMRKQDNKVMGALYAARRFPNVVFKIGKAKKDHTGMTDSLCIADYCRLINQ